MLSNQNTDGDVVRQRRIFYVSIMTLLACAGLLLVSIINRAIHVDDSWFAEEAYWLMKDGVVKSIFFGDLLGYNVQQFAYHKLHIWLAAAAFKIFGFSIFVIKAIPLMCFVMLIWVMNQYLRRHFTNERPLLLVLLLILLVGNSLIVEEIFIYRPEVILALLGFVSFYFLRKSEPKKISDIVLAGIFAGLAVLEHLNGIIFVIAGGVLLLVEKRGKSIFIYGLAAISVAAFYFIEIFPNHWADFIYQFRNDPALSNSQFSLANLFTRLVTEPDRYFGHGYEATYTLLFITLLVLQRKAIQVNTELKALFVYSAALMVALAMLANGKGNFYLVPQIPLIGILVAVSLYKILINPTPSAKYVVSLSFLYLVANAVHTINVMRDGSRSPEANERIVQRFQLPSGSIVRASLPFIFYGLEKFTVHGSDGYFIRVRKQMTQKSAAEFFDESNRQHDQFLLLEDYRFDDLGIHVPNDGDELFGYRCLGHEDIYYVLEKLNVPVNTVP